ncbi:MAG: hypothetical protein DMG83_02400 [Acidobacteria bacterium]|nr:MAG: hypothetical protein DMG83_02400 [Acidobacteriota bacterium]
MKLRILTIAFVLLAIVYLCDDLAVRYRIPRSREPLGTVTIQRYDAISEKNNKTEFDFESPITVTCVHSLFPHMGYQPCWYLSRDSEQRINY